MHAEKPWMRIGRRGVVLLLLSVLWFLMALNIYINGASSSGEYLFFSLIPHQIRSVLWLVTGVIAGVYAFVPKRVTDGPGFMALVAMPIERAIAYLIALVAEVVLPGPTLSRPTSYLVSLGMWAAISGLIITISGWKENNDPLPEPGELFKRRGD